MASDPTPLDPPLSSGNTTNFRNFDGDDPTWVIAATEPRALDLPANAPSHLSHPAKAREAQAESDTEQLPAFWPESPESFAETGLRSSQVEALVLKYLLHSGDAAGREIATQIALPFRMVQRLLYSMKEATLLSLKSDAALGDYQYELTQLGAERARRYAEQCSYFGAAPVPLDQYARSVTLQSIRQISLTPEIVRQAFHDLVLSQDLSAAVGEALNLGRGMFLHGAPGNGKSSIAERIGRAFTQDIWIPRALSAGGEIVRLFDSIHHREVMRVEDDAESRPFDRRWVRVQRPILVVGGELDLEAFDVSTNAITGISEAPLQLKSNCGTLVIDDFGRNRFRPEELLNRLVVPLERHFDSLHLNSGRTFRVPFDCLMVFSSNRDPVEFVDEAFLRRIPFKIDVNDPTEVQFRELLKTHARRAGLQLDDSLVDHLLREHYRSRQAPLRFCHPRDLIQMIANACQFHRLAPRVTQELIDNAVVRYLHLNGR
jgi:hypothetical protein